jgi:hypothetical protein
MDHLNDQPKNYTERSQLPTLEESRSAQKINYLIQLGLGSEKSKLNMYRRVLSDPRSAVANQITRQYTAEVLEKLLDMIFNDSTLWNRTKTLLQRKHSKSISSLREDISEDGMRALISKSNEHEVPLEVIFEVYSRGAQDATEREGFGRVNSFLAGGKARRLDGDLLGETIVQPLQEKDKTLSVVKRVLSESKRRI